MTIDIIIPVYRRTDWIQRCMDCLGQQENAPRFSLTIVDDGSPSREAMREIVLSCAARQNYPVAFIEHAHGGPAVARNEGVRRSKGDLICFLDDDSLPDVNWLAEIVGVFDRKDVGLVSGRTLSAIRDDSLSLRLEKAVYSGKSWATNNIAYRRSVFEALGGFDESFPEPSWEDNDLGIRARWAGYRHEYCERAIVYHPHEQTIDEYRRKCLLNGRGAAVFSRRHFSTKPVWAVATPLLIARRLLYGVSPLAWVYRERSIAFLRFYWAAFSLIGYFRSRRSLS